jgi:hypothetical protein
MQPLAGQMANLRASLFTRGAVGGHLYRFEKRLTRLKSSSHFDSMFYQNGTIHFASSAEKLYQHQSVPNKPAINV